MNSNLKNRNLFKYKVFIIFILFLFVFTFNKSYASENSGGMSKVNIINEIKNSYGEYDIDKDYINEAKKYLESSIKDSDYFFILGYFDYLDENYKQAVQNFELAKNDIDKSKEQVVKIYNYILLNRCLLKEKQYDELVENANFSINYIKKDNNYKNNQDLIWEVIETLINNSNTHNAAINILNSYIEDTRDLELDCKVALRGNLGLLYAMEKDYADAIYNYLDVIYITQHHPQMKHSQVYKAKGYILIGSLMAELGIDEKAISWYNRALDVEIPNKNDEAEVKSNVYINKMDIYIKLKDYEKCNEILAEAKKCIPYLDNDTKDDIEILIYMNEANINIEQMNLNEAEKQLNKSVELLENDKNQIFLYKETFVGFSQAKLYKAQGKYNESLGLYKELLKDSQAKGLDLDLEIYKDIADVYADMGDLRKYIEYNYLVDKKEREIQEIIRSDYVEYAIKAYENDKLKEKEKNNEIKTLIITGILIIMSILLIARIRRIKTLKNLNYIDGMTKLYNRKYLDDYELKHRDKLINEEVSIILLDIDYFKKYNDNYGHIKGDEVIKEVSGCILKNIRKGDIGIRFGGEEMLIVLENTSSDEAKKIAIRIQENLRNRNIKHEYSPICDIVTVSMGIYTKKAGIEEYIYNSIDKADKALYISKNNGRNKYTVLNEI